MIGSRHAVKMVGNDLVNKVMVIEIRKPIDGIKMVVYLMAESFLSPQSITGVFP